MDKSYFSCKEEKSIPAVGEGGMRLILSVLSCICACLTLINATIALYGAEEVHGKASETVVAVAEAFKAEERVIEVFKSIGNDKSEIY